MVDRVPDDFVYKRDYRTYEYYKKVNGRLCFTRTLTPKEIKHGYFSSGHSFRHKLVRRKRGNNGALLSILPALRI